MHEPRCPRRGRQSGNTPRAVGMDGLEGRAAAFRQDTRQIDDQIRPLHRSGHTSLIGHRRGQRHDLADGSHRFEEQGGLGIAHRDPHDMAALRQALDYIAPDEPRSAENRRNPGRRHTHISRIPFAAAFSHRRDWFAMGNRAPKAPTKALGGLEGG